MSDIHIGNLNPGKKIKEHKKRTLINRMKCRYVLKYFHSNFITINKKRRCLIQRARRTFTITFIALYAQNQMRNKSNILK